ncbi:MAG: STAS domain-containing protein [Acidobacteriaceae bacterium]|nr:STAS domain-containing protein [Acidobacteriaceae bacterium]MBV9296287.1 STAS domain-containing protein [Acidobacteriaceae bacterium]MBV9765851.1 STAS domain-containing protein [Acidobacteriaceae bacterium]
MPLEVHRREAEGVTILDLQGRLVVGAESSDLRRRFTQLVDQQTTKVILNLKQVDYIDSTGLGTLVIGHSLIEKTGGYMKLLNLTRRNIQLLVLTKLSTVFEIFDDEQAAINSFFPDREVKRFDILEFVKSHDPEKPSPA